MDLYADGHAANGWMRPDEVGISWDGSLKPAIDYGMRCWAEHKADGGPKRDWRCEVRVNDAAEPLLWIDSERRWTLMNGTVAGRTRTSDEHGRLQQAMTALRDALREATDTSTVRPAADRVLEAYGITVSVADQGTGIGVVEHGPDGPGTRTLTGWWNGQVWAAADRARQARRNAIEAEPGTDRTGTRWEAWVDGAQRPLLAVGAEGRVVLPAEGPEHEAVRLLRRPREFDGVLQALHDTWTDPGARDERRVRERAAAAVERYGMRA